MVVSGPLKKEAVLAKVAGMSNRLAFQSNMYLMSGVQGAVYFRAAMWRWSDTFYTRLSNMINGKTRATATTTGDFTAVAELYDADFDVLDTKSIRVKVANPVDETTPFLEYVQDGKLMKRDVFRDSIHPSSGYKQIGARLAAFIQYVR